MLKIAEQKEQRTCPPSIPYLLFLPWRSTWKPAAYKIIARIYSALGAMYVDGGTIKRAKTR